MQQNDWGERLWNESHFPEGDLDTVGDTWGMRWRGVEKLRHASYLRALGAVLKQPRPLDVLDIGCALCDFTEKAWAVDPSNQFWVMDVAENAISWVEHRFPTFQCKVAALPEIPFDVQFDVILCLEVLCYLDPDGRKETIRRIHRRLKPSGVTMFSGVLDGGQRHHTRDEVMGLFSQEFDIELVSYNHWWFYKRVLQRPLDNLYSKFSNLRQKLDMSAGEFQIHPGSSAIKARILRALRGARPVSGILVSALLKTVRWFLSLRLLAEMAQKVSQPVRRTQNADEIIILARKKSGVSEFGKAPELVAKNLPSLG